MSAAREAWEEQGAHSRTTQGEELEMSALETALELRLAIERNDAVDDMGFCLRLVGAPTIPRRLLLHCGGGLGRCRV